ncbi:hypothetical protein PC129_g19787 [Phytophthora cactorum]|uniref:Uncharacterized protein n=1 Tax=Phytophthora cactorum TaxID=29920 RepID=A0A8T1BGW3_9STRA|nr:hypothetical protein PC112_g20691 [Phytophthora cactorum]KAG2803907.1 hypothetical protein PC111_g18493 [Phytophthora cactorum]KAG2852016.1 hypothetical protein PC113_g15401 [Phytophthora cactorum]KAG2879382.1 hypothetical protein PC114_g22587 [Phytophthora cactorum]KAG2899081.1 hypothetical protein PC117_g22367 [Phytophthora cactorum]
MDRNEFPHLNDSQYESVRKMAGTFDMDALQSLVAATPAEQVERVNASMNVGLSPTCGEACNPRWQK